MQLLALMTKPKSNVYTINIVRGYDFGEEDLVVHRNVTDGLLWRISDVKTGSNFGFISPSKKQAIQDFYDGRYLNKYLEFKKTPKYMYLIKRFEEAKRTYLEQKREDEENVSEMGVPNFSENPR